MPARLLINDQTQSLLREIFADGRLFEGDLRIRKRVVRWGIEAKTLELPHDGLVVCEQNLVDRLWQKTGILEPAQSIDNSPRPAWTVVASPGLGSLPAPNGFGARRASTASVVLRSDAAKDCCWIESLPEGWLFLLPAGDGRAVLIGAGYAPAELIEQSGLIASQISNVNLAAPNGVFPAFPQILTSLCGPGWVACGSAAMTFDPLCGEGAGHAAREAILAAAVLSATAKRPDEDKLFSHYSTRLMQGYLRHLRACLPFYRSGGSSGFWHAEAEALERGIAWIECRLRGCARFTYSLCGFDMVPIGSS
jgi:hypothetical protein